MVEVGKVERIDRSGYATVVFDRKQACEHCQMCLQSKKDMKVYVRVKNVLNASIGDNVSVEMTERVVLRSAFVVYLIPVVLIAVALLATAKLGETIQIIAFVSSLVLSVAIDIAVDRILKSKNKSFAKMTSLITADASDSTATDNADNTEE